MVFNGVYNDVYMEHQIQSDASRVFFPCHPLFGNVSQSPTVPAGIAQAGGAGLTGLDRQVDQLLGGS